MADDRVLRVLVTGAAGQIAYSLIHSICKGDVFGLDQPVALHLLDIPPMMGVLEGVAMEVRDCAFSLLKDLVPTCREEDAFKDIDAAFLVGAMPRKEGMERKDLLAANVKIFKSQGKALDRFASKDVKVLVVGNPANTNSWICSYYARSIPKENFSAMTRLDQNRAQAQLAEKLNVPVSEVHDVYIWGNHSNTQFPDASLAHFKRNGVALAVKDELSEEYLNNIFIETVQKRGAAVISARKLSSAMSAAKAACDHMRDWWQGTGGQCVSMAVFSNGSPYPTDLIPEDIVSSFPVSVGADRKWSIKPGVSFSAHAEKMIRKTIQELQEEREEAKKVCEEE